MSEWHGSSPESLPDVLERVLGKGVAVVGDNAVNVLDVDVLAVRLRSSLTPTRPPRAAGRHRRVDAEPANGRSANGGPETGGPVHGRPATGGPVNVGSAERQARSSPWFREFQPALGDNAAQENPRPPRSAATHGSSGD